MPRSECAQGEQFPLIIGHRGAPGYRPEHTESSYLLAFEQGVDAVEPDLVATRDGVLVIRHENEISGTTDVADRPEFADRCTTKVIDGVSVTGWFTEDFTWDELQTLRCRERVPRLRPQNAAFNDQEPMLRLRDLIMLMLQAQRQHGREIRLVIELKHVQFFMDQGLDLVKLLLDELSDPLQAGNENGQRLSPRDLFRGRLTIECFELGALRRLRAIGADEWADLVFLLEHEGCPADELTLGNAARSYDWYRSDEGLDELRHEVRGISVSKRDLLQVDRSGLLIADSDLVARAHARGLLVYCWTLRPENAFLPAPVQAGQNAADWGDWAGEWKLILETGVDGVFVDHPDLMQRI